MNIQEFSNTFDTLLNSYKNQAIFGEASSRADIVFDEYEKSVYLTKAQDAYVKELYSGKYTADSFEVTEEVRRQLDALVETAIYKNSIKADSGLHDRFQHCIYELPEDCWYIIYEQVSYGKDIQKCKNGIVADVIPCTHDQYQRTINNPFRGPYKNRVLRLDKGNKLVELVSSYDIDEYTLRYIKEPEPIILCNLTGTGLDIKGKMESQTCKLSESVHQEILDKAITMALTNITNLSKNNTSK